jgi:hypothetical protein
MIRWLAPLLLLFGKPEMVIRIALGVAAIAAAVIGVWLLSHIALTFDALKSPTIAALYGAVLISFLVAVGTFAWFRIRPAARPYVQELDRKPRVPEQSPQERAEELYRKFLKTHPAAGGADPPDAPPAAAPAERLRSALPATATLTVAGPAQTGKTALIATLTGAAGVSSAGPADLVRLLEAPAIEAGENGLETLLARASASDAVLFVVDNDLRASDVAAIERVGKVGKPIYIVLNKSDRFGAADRDTILGAIRRKLPAGFPPDNVVATAAAPGPVERRVVDAQGATRIDVRRPPTDTRELTDLLTRVVPPAAGRTLRFERK